jgi:PAS domain S-box-containing protein
LINDVTAVKRSEELLRYIQDRIRILTESFTDYAIFSTDTDGRIDSWNPGAANIFGYIEDEILGQPYEMLFTPEDVVNGVPVKEMRMARKSGRASDERWQTRKDGTRFFASGVMAPLYVGNSLSGYAKITSDRTERQRSTEALQQSRDELEIRVIERTRELAAANAALVAEINERKTAERQKIEFLQRLVTSQEGQRQRIARDLHDQLGQRLTALRLKIAAMKDVCSHDENLRARAIRLQEISELLDSEVSFLAWELRPFALDELGLVDAIGTFVREWSKHYEIPADFHSSGLSGVHLDQNADSHLYRIAQEALNNVVKHAKASGVNVLLEKTGEELILIVEDDGVGITPKRSNGRKGGKGLGLEGMGERASLIGGTLEIESTPGLGTTIYVRLPLTNGK